MIICYTILIIVIWRIVKCFIVLQTLKIEETYKAIKEYVAEKASDKLKYFETEDFVYLPKGETSAYYDANKDLYLNESLYRDDNLHLNREGYRLLGQAISACL